MVGNVKEWVEIRQDPSQPVDPSAYGLSKGGGFRDGEWMASAWSSDGMLGVEVTSQANGIRCAADPID